MSPVIDEELIADLAAGTLAQGAEYCDIYAQHSEVTQVRFDDGRVDDVSTGVDQGAGVRVISGDFAAYAHTDFLDRDHLKRALETATAALAHCTEGSPLMVVGVERDAPAPVCAPPEDGEALTDIVARLGSCDYAARSLGDEVVQVTALHAEGDSEWLLANSLGETSGDRCHRTRLVVQVVAAKDGVVQVGMEGPGRLLARSFYREVDAEETARTAARRAIAMLGARPSPTGKMPVVVNSGTGGVLLHEASGHGLEADHLRKGASVYGGRLGEVVASTVVTAADDPTLEGLWGSYVFDDEGTPSTETVLIEDGVLCGFLYGRHEAMRSAVASTGNGRRQSFRSMPIPRMSNTFIKPGHATHDELIGDTKRGIYAHKMGGGQVDPATGDFVFGVSEGYLIENGRLGTAVRGATLVGNGPRTLEAIDAVGDDLSFDEGTCGKEGQGVPVATGCPTFRIAELTIGGTEI